MEIAVRCDLGKSIGYGHAIRCLALSQAAIDDGIDVTFFMNCTNDYFSRLLNQESISLVSIPGEPGDESDLLSMVSHLKESSYDWIVLDGYNFSLNYQTKLVETSTNLLFLDDCAHLKLYKPDLLLNQNPYASEKLYDDRTSSISQQMLLGSKYILLRRLYKNHERQELNPEPPPINVLVSFGGADPDGATKTILKYLQGCENLTDEIVVVAGSGCDDLDTINALSKKLSADLFVDVENMKNLLSRVDLAICGGGSINYELAYMGVPTINLVLSENQVKLSRYLDTEGFTRNLGRINQLDRHKFQDVFTELCQSTSKRLEMSERGRSIVDGFGSDRVIEKMKKYINLREVEPDDCKLLFDWANEETVRRSSFSTEEINWEEHQQWFQNKLDDDLCFHYIGFNELESSPIGQIRFDREDSHAVVNVSIDKTFRGQGYGTSLIRLGSERIFHDCRRLNTLHAWIKPENEGSIRAFKKAGYSLEKTGTYKGHRSELYLLNREDVEPSPSP